MRKGSIGSSGRKCNAAAKVPSKKAVGSKIAPKNTWVAGGHAPKGKPSKALAKRVEEYLRRTGQIK